MPFNNRNISVADVKLLCVGCPLHLALLLPNLGGGSWVPDHHLAAHGHTEQARRCGTRGRPVDRVHPVHQFAVPGAHLCFGGEADEERLKGSVRGVKSQLCLLPLTTDGDRGELSKREVLLAGCSLAKERERPKVHPAFPSTAQLQLKDHLLPTSASAAKVHPNGGFTRQLSTTSSRPSILSSCGTCVNCFNCSACPGCTVIPNRSMASAAEPKPGADAPTHTGQQWEDNDLRSVRFQVTGQEKQVNPQWSQELIQEVPIKMVATRLVSCDGGGGALGHPRVYINLDG